MKHQMFLPIFAICLMALLFTVPTVNADPGPPGQQMITLPVLIGPAPPMLTNCEILEKFIIGNDSVCAIPERPAGTLVSDNISPQGNGHVERGSKLARSWIPFHESSEFLQAIMTSGNQEGTEVYSKYTSTILCLSDNLPSPLM